MPKKSNASRNYQFIVYDSNMYDKAPHPVTGVATPGLHTKISDITKQARDKKLDFTMNKAGQVTFRLPLTSSGAFDVVDYEIKRSLVVYVDDVSGNPTPVWSGPIWNTDLSTDNTSVAVTAVGWLEILNHRELRQPAYYNNLDAGLIATRLLSTANNQISNQNIVNASTASTNSQRTGINQGGLSGEDLFFGAGDFESNGNWQGTASGPISLSSDWVASGANSLKITDPGGNSSAALPAYIQPTANEAVNSGESSVNVSSNTLYQIRGMVNTTANSLGSVVWVNYIDASGSIIAGSPIVLTIPAGLNGEFIGTFTTSSTCVRVNVRLAMNRSLTPGAAQTAYYDAFTMSKTAVNVVPTPIRIGSIASPANPAGANRTRTYTVGQKIGLAIEELSQIEAGFDYEVALVPTTISGGATILRNLNIYYGTVKGTIVGQGQDRPNTFFGHRWGPNNVLSVRETHDSSKLANRINARAAGMLSMAQDPTSISLRGLMEDSINISDPGVGPSTLLGYAGTEVVFRAAPFKIFNMTPFPWDGDTTGRIPRFGIDYAIGDICYLVADNGAMKIGISTGAPQPVRIFGVSISVDMEGNERVDSIQTTAP